MRNFFRLLITSLFGLIPIMSAADGFIIAPPEYVIQETGQQAVLVYDEKTQLETMMISMTYQGTADEFVWIIPTPGKPEIERGSHDLIPAIEQVINPQRVINYSEQAGMFNVGAADAVTAAVTVVEQKQVDYYDATVLEATSAEDLVEWLNSNGYTFPAESTHLLTDYITNGWYFTALKIQNTVDVDSVTADLQEGKGTPVQLTFQAQNLVYPLRISAITQSAQPNSDNPFIDNKKQPADQAQNIILYVFAGTKVEAVGFSTIYADWLKRDEIEAFAINTNGNPWVTLENRKYFLTKLAVTLAPSEMTEDVFLKAADHNTTVDQNRARWEAEDILTAILATVFMSALGLGLTTFSPFGLLAVGMTILRGRTKSKGWRIFAHVMQWVSYSLFVGISLIILYMLAQEISVSYFIDEWKYSYSKDQVAYALALLISLGFVNLVFFWTPIIQSIVLFRRNRQKHA